MNNPAITSLTIDFGPVINTLDYNGDGNLGDQVFVVTSGGLGSVAPVSAVKGGNAIQFDFGNGIGGGVGGQHAQVAGTHASLLSPDQRRGMVSWSYRKRVSGRADSQ